MCIAWDPGVARDPQEFDVIRNLIKLVSDLGNYWIGGVMLRGEGEDRRL